MKLKTVLYNATVILPVISRIVSGAKLIIELVSTNKQVLEAFKEMHEDVRFLRDFEERVSQYQETMNGED